MIGSARRFTFAHLAAALCLALALPQAGLAQAPNGPPNGPPRQGDGPPQMPTIEPDPRVQQLSYHFADADADMAYTLYVSSKVDPATPAPLIVALHGFGGDSNFILRGKLVDLAEEGGYVVVGPMGYNVAGWYGSPVIVMGGGEVDPPNLRELSEQDVMNVLAMAREEFNIDPDRTYLMGHSMGGAGAIYLGQKYADQWAAVAAIAPAAFMMQPDEHDILTPYKDDNLPLMIIQGDADTVVPPDNTRTWAASMDEMDLPDHAYIEIPGGDHGTVIADGMPDIFTFFAEHTRSH